MITLVRLLTILVFSQNLQVLCQRNDGIDRLAITSEIVVHHIDIEQILPLASDNRQRLNLRQINLVEREDCQDVGEATLFVILYIVSS